jgi:hypothetical protein
LQKEIYHHSLQLLLRFAGMHTHPDPKKEKIHKAKAGNI